MPGPSAIRALDMRLIDDLFEMGGGYVLDFSDRTFAEFFATELRVDIDAPRYSAEGTSKAKRLRYFLNVSDTGMRVRALEALWEYREGIRKRKREQEKVPDAEKDFRELLARMGGKRASTVRPRSSAPGVTSQVFGELRRKLLEISALTPQQRGFAFERFLKRLFDVHGLAGRASFRLVGEQIDGSFELSRETYLLEARWRGARTGAADLRAFNGKVEAMAAWSRGLFVSISGFSPDGLVAFGRGKRVICLDGLDLNDMLEREILFSTVIARKVRSAAESGEPFVRVRDLFQ